MGADLLLTYCPEPQASPEELHRRINALSETVLEGIGQDLGLDPNDAETSVQDFLHKAVSEVIEQPGLRDLTTLTFDGREWIFTGGMSWGDPPTESYDYVTALSLSGICDDGNDLTVNIVANTELKAGDVLVGDAGGHCLIFEVARAHVMPGMLRAETEHGPLYLDPEETSRVLA